MGKCSARRKARFMCTFRTPRQTASKTAKCILSSSFLTQAQPWRLEGAEPTFPGTWEWVVLPDTGRTFDKVEERLMAGSSLFLFSIVVSIPTCHAGDRGSISRRGDSACPFIFLRPWAESKKSQEESQLHWPGIEPGPPAWQARILPLNHQCTPHIETNGRKRDRKSKRLNSSH